MRAIRDLLKDRRRRQRGSVLSAVLIMTAFIAIISGALMTELSTNLMVSRTLVNRVAYQATENAAIEQSISALQARPLNATCPSLSTTTLNGVSAAPAYLSCWPTRRESPNSFVAAGAGAAFQVDGTHARVNGLDDYVVGDAAGNVIDIPFGWSIPRWTLALGGQVTATPLVVSRPGSSNQVLDVIPLTGAACGSSTTCLNVRLDTAGRAAAPTLVCVAAAPGAPVISEPAFSPTVAGLVYYGFGSTLAATDVSSSGSTCDYEASVGTRTNQPISSGPVAFPCTSGCGHVEDNVYVIVGDGSSSYLLRYGYSSGSLSYVSSLSLPWTSVSGVAASASNLPADLAITFAGGGVGLIQIAANGSMSLVATASAGTGVTDAPYWCHCPGADEIGVGGQNGALYVYNSGLQLLGASAAGSAIDTAPAADGAGDWYFGARDGFVHELQLAGGSAAQVDSFGPMGQVTSGVQVGGCGTGICIYTGASDDQVYLVPLDTRRAVISACIAGGGQSCSGANPRLWTSLEVGASGSPQSVHIEGWSYYSG